MRKSLAKSPLSAAMPMLFLLTSLLPAAGRADDSNLLGLFYDTGGTVDQVAIDPYTQHALYLVLLNPVNDGFGGSGTRDVGSVAGFECGIVPPSGDMLLSVEFPALAINVGSTNNLIVGFASAVPVSSSRAATLATVRVMSFGNNRAGYLLSTATPQSIPGSWPTSTPRTRATTWSG